MLRQILNRQLQLSRQFTSSKNISLSSSTLESEKVAAGVSEANLRAKLASSLPKASCIEVEDISGGCGAMYQIYVEAPEFEGLNKVKQHQLINKILKEEIKTMHGIRINTSVPKPTL